jgi:hypothetical protein
LIEGHRQIGKQSQSRVVADVEVIQSSQPVQRATAITGDPDFLRDEAL